MENKIEIINENNVDNLISGYYDPESFTALEDYEELYSLDGMKISSVCVLNTVYKCRHIHYLISFWCHLHCVC